MYTRTAWSGLAVFLVLLLVGPICSQEQTAVDAHWLERMETEGKAVSAKYQALVPRLDEEFEDHAEQAPGPAKTKPYRARTTRRRTVRLGDNVIHEQVRVFDDAPNRPQIRLECDNSAYYFTLGKMKEESRYALAEYEPRKRKYPLASLGFAMHQSAYDLLRHILAAIENKDKFTLRALRFDDTKGLLRVEYTNANGRWPVENVVYLDPNHAWRVVEQQTRSAIGESTGRWTYGVVVEGVEFPTASKTITNRKSADVPNMDITGRLISIKITDKTPDDFRLSAFGLPEPADVAPPAKPTRWYLWILAAAGACAALSLSFVYLRRRRQARLAPGNLQGKGP